MKGAIAEKASEEAEAAGILELREVTFAPTACAPDEAHSCFAEIAKFGGFALGVFEASGSACYRTSA